MSKPEPHAGLAALENRRVLYLLAEAVEKLLRLRGILDRQRAFVAARNEKAEYAGVIDPLIAQLDEQTERLSRNSARIALFLSDKQLDRGEAAALPGILQKVIDVVLGLHEVLILLPREAVEAQVFQVLQSCFASEWKDSSIVLTNALEAYEYRIEDILENLKDLGQKRLKRWRSVLRGFTRSGSVLAQSFIDRDNPLAWPVLAHEYGHALDEAGGISKHIVHGDLPVGSVVPENREGFELKWTSEIFADFVAARVLGGASQIPILLLEMTRPLVKVSEQAPNHPPTSARLALVRNYLKDLDVTTDGFGEIFDLYRFDYEQKLSELDENERVKRRKLDEMMEGFQPHVEAIALRVNSLNMRLFGGEQDANARGLVAKLRSDLPISSLRHVKDDMVSRELDSLVASAASPEQVYKVLSVFNETPSTCAEILNAGWLYKLTTFEEHLRNSFASSSSPQNMNLEKYGEYLARTDELLLQSIEHAAVHTVIVGG